MSGSYRWPVVVGVLGIGLCVVASSILIQGFGGWNTTFQGPGSVTIEVPAAGNYRLWHESRTTIDGRLQVVGDELPSGSVVEFAGVDGTTIPLQALAGSMYQELGTTRRVALGRIEFPEPGRYMASVTGFEQPRMFHLSEIRFFDYFLRALVFALPGMLLAGIGLIWVIVISTRRRRTPS